jgi:hypothetical protein
VCARPWQRSPVRCGVDVLEFKLALSRPRFDRIGVGQQLIAGDLNIVELRQRTDVAGGKELADRVRVTADDRAIERLRDVGAA